MTARAEDNGPTTPTDLPPWASHRLLQPVVTATYWFDPGRGTRPYSTSIRFSGHRTDVSGKPRSGDTFVKLETIEPVIPGSGPVAVTTRVRGVNPGQWAVVAKPVSDRGRRSPGPHRSIAPLNARARPKGLLRSKGNPIVGGAVEATTRLGPLATAPGIIAGAWPGFVATGVVIAVGLLIIVGRSLGLPVGRAVGVALGASIAGAVGSRLWYLALERGRVGVAATQGLCIQGFIVGLVAAGLVGLAFTDMSPGLFLDAVTPGLFFAMVLGRQGCFFTGCCSGRPTAARWGIWSSNGRVGVRRVPTQQLESLLCLVIGSTTLFVALGSDRAGRGGIFIGAAAAYTVGRQVLFGLRAEPRRTKFGRPTTMAVATVLLAVDVVLLAPS